MRALGARGYPSAALVDPSGTVVWTGHPARLDAATIEKHLDGAFLQPVWEWPKSARKVVKALGKRKLADALERATELAAEDDSAAGIRDAIAGMIERRMAVLEKAWSDGDVLLAKQLAEAARSELDGIDQYVDRAKEIVAAIRKDREAKRVLRFQEKLADLQSERIRSKGDVEDLIEAAEDLMEDAEGTYAAKQIAEFLDGLRAMLR